MGEAVRGFSNLIDAGPVSVPKPTLLTPKPPDAEESVINAKLMARRKQLGLISGDMDTSWLTGARGDSNPPPIGTKTLLGS